MKALDEKSGSQSYDVSPRDLEYRLVRNFTAKILNAMNFNIFVALDEKLIAKVSRIYSWQYTPLNSPGSPERHTLPGNHECLYTISHGFNQELLKMFSLPCHS